MGKFLFVSRFFMTVVIIFFLSFATKTFASENLNISKLIKARIAAGYNVGIVVAVIDKNGTSFYKLGKVAKNPKAAQVTEDTVFPVASITKVFTTLLLADEVVQGRVKLSDEAQQFLSDEIKLPIYKNRQITLEDLATHTTGIPEFGERQPSAQGTYPGYNLEKLYETLNQLQFNAPPGTKYQYSNLIGLLGYITANIADQSYDELLQEKILTPLAMKNTKLIPFPSPQNTKVTGYDATEKPGVSWPFPVLESAGALHSNAKDLAKFVAANMGINKTKLYPAMQLAHIPIHSQGEPLIDFDFPGIEKLQIGLGWNIDTEHSVIWKNGNFPNFSSFIGFNPKTNRGVVVLANTGNIAYVDNLALHILNPMQIKLLPLYKEINLNNNEMDKFSGRYKMNDHSFYTFVAENNHLKSQHIANDEASEYFNLYPMSKNEFFAKIVDAVFTFTADKTGKIKLKLKEGRHITFGEKVKDKTNEDNV